MSTPMTVWQAMRMADKMGSLWWDAVYDVRDQLVKQWGSKRQCADYRAAHGNPHLRQVNLGDVWCGRAQLDSAPD